VRRIKQITGDDEFSEIFFDDVEIPFANRVGEEGDGWAVANKTLASERGLTLVELTQRMRASLRRFNQLMRDHGVIDDSATRRDFGETCAKVNASCALADQYLLKRISGEEAAGDASIVKLYYARAIRDFTTLGLKISGLDGQYQAPFTAGGSQETGNWGRGFHEFLQLVDRRRERRSSAQHHRREDARHAARTQELETRMSSEMHDELRHSARAVLSELGPTASEDAVWKQVVDLGWLLAAAPEELGGLGLGLPGACVLYNELGRSVAAAPFTAAMLAIDAACYSHISDRKAWIEKLTTGFVATASLIESSGELIAAVPSADKAQYVLVATPTLVALAPLAGAEVTPRPTWDVSRRCVRRTCEG